MRNLGLFLWKYHFTVVFILLEVIAVTLLSTNNAYQRTRMHSTGLAISGAFFAWQESFAGYVNLVEENEVLRQQNAMLENRLFERYTRNKSTQIGAFQVLPAIVVNSTYNQGNNYVIVDAGRQEGVETRMGVHGPEGIVGIVTHVSDEFSAIMPLIHSQSRVSCLLQNTNYFGRLRWEGGNHRVAILEDIPNHVEVDSGEAVITRGGGGIFPRGLLVGYTLETEKDPSSGFQTIEVELATNFEKINSTFIIQNQLQPELDSLTNAISENE